MVGKNGNFQISNKAKGEGLSREIEIRFPSNIAEFLLHKSLFQTIALELSLLIRIRKRLYGPWWVAMRFGGKCYPSSFYKASANPSHCISKAFLSVIIQIIST